MAELGTLSVSYQKEYKNNEIIILMGRPHERIQEEYAFP